jgi:hypothetical protein
MYLKTLPCSCRKHRDSRLRKNKRISGILSDVSYHRRKIVTLESEMANSFDNNFVTSTSFRCESENFLLYIIHVNICFVRLEILPTYSVSNE